MESIEFQAPEYQQDGTFQMAEFLYKGDETKGWLIRRNGEDMSKLGPGYTLVKTLYCGICSTDLDRRFLPYPLPQVIGHEVVGSWQGKTVVSEINASHLARNLESSHCAPCQAGMDSHCPDRITLGIDRLPGGFAPYFLAPVNGIVEVPSTITPEIAALTEPLAAALQAVKRTPPQKGDSVAVLGPRRLGSLIIAALAAFRRKQNRDFSITGLVRHQSLVDLCTNLGADKVIQVDSQSLTGLKKQFDIVYDTSGTPEGFMNSLDLAKRVIHLKSTNGQSVLGLDYLTEMVVDEIGLLPFSTGNLLFSWLDKVQSGEVLNVFVSPSVGDDLLREIETLRPKAKIIKAGIQDALKDLVSSASSDQKDSFNRFDTAVVSDFYEINEILRPEPDNAQSLVRPRGTILLAGDSALSGNKMADAISLNNLEIHTSRCGDFNAALQILENNPSLMSALQQKFITHHFPLDQLQKAFEVAADSGVSIKAMVDI